MKPLILFDTVLERLAFSPVLRGGLIEAGRVFAAVSMERSFPPCFAGASLKHVLCGANVDSRDMFSPVLRGGLIEASNARWRNDSDGLVFPRASRGPH